MPCTREAIDRQWQSYFLPFYTKRGCYKTIQPKWLEPPYYLWRIFTILVEESEESMPTVISNFLNVIEKGAWTGPFCFVSKVLFFITESKLDSIGSRMRKAPQGLHGKFHAKYSSALRDLLNSNYMLASMDLAFVPRWAIQQGYQIGQKYIFVETRRCLPGWAICVHVCIHAFCLLSVIQQPENCSRNAHPKWL